MSITTVTVRVEHVVRLDDLTGLTARTTDEPSSIYCCHDGCEWEISAQNHSFFYLVQQVATHEVTEHAR